MHYTLYTTCYTIIMMLLLPILCGTMSTCLWVVGRHLDRLQKLGLIVSCAGYKRTSIVMNMYIPGRSYALEYSCGYANVRPPPSLNPM